MAMVRSNRHPSDLQTDARVQLRSNVADSDSEVRKLGQLSSSWGSLLASPSCANRTYMGRRRKARRRVT
jgi:hypothetical protein